LHKRKLVLMLAALLALAAIVAGCGGGGSSSSSGESSSSSSVESESSSDGSSSDESGSDEESGSDDSGGAAPTKAAFIKEADGICGKADAAMSKEITEFAKENGIATEEEEPSEDQQIEILHSVVLPNLAKQAEDVAALTPPAGEEETVEEIVETLSSEIQEAEEADGVPDESTLAEARKKAQAYGLTICGS
jgi:flagellum-specific peptidoglycan hydrolase FlgJ